MKTVLVAHVGKVVEAETMGLHNKFFFKKTNCWSFVVLIRHVYYFLRSFDSQLCYLLKGRGCSSSSHWVISTYFCTRMQLFSICSLKLRQFFFLNKTRFFYKFSGLNVNLYNCILGEKSTSSYLRFLFDVYSFHWNSKKPWSQKQQTVRKVKDVYRFRNLKTSFQRVRVETHEFEVSFSSCNFPQFLWSWTLQN